MVKMMLRSCCCCSLRGGALAVSIVLLSLSVLQLLGVLIGWGTADAVRASHHRWMIERESLGQGGSYYYGDVFPGVEILVPVTIFVLVQLTFDALLVHGIRLSPTRPSQARCCLVAWLIFRGVLFGLFTLGDVALLIWAIIARYTGGEMMSVAFGGHFVLATIVIGLFWYAWAVVLSFYWSLRSGEERGVVYNRMRMETTAMNMSRDVGRVEEHGEASAPGMAVDGQSYGQSSGQKWA